MDTEATDLPRTKPIADKGKIPHPSSLTPSTQDVYRVYCLRKNCKRDYTYRIYAVMHYERTQV